MDLWLIPWVGFWLGPLDGCARGWFAVRGWVWVWVCFVGGWCFFWCEWFQWVVCFAGVCGFGFGLGLGFGVARVLLVGQTVPDQ